MLCVTENNSGRVTAKGSDDMGRWTYQTLTCKGDKSLTMISAYQVCKQQLVNNSRVSTLTATAQQISALRQQGRDILPRKAFTQDLESFIAHEHGKGNGILLVGDFNEPLDTLHEGMTKLCSNTGLIDLMFHLHGVDEFNTWIDGKARVDYVLCDAWVAESCLNGCYEPFKYRFKGDHRNIILDFNEDLLFGNPTYALHTQAQREFTSKDKKSNRKYIEFRHEYMTTHKAQERLEELGRN